MPAESLPPPPSPLQPSPPLRPLPNADRHLLELHALVGRQLRSTFLHGSSRTWRDRRRIWPAVLVAAAIVALLIAGFSVLAAFDRQQQLDSVTSASEPARPRALDDDWIRR